VLVWTKAFSQVSGLLDSVVLQVKITTYSCMQAAGMGMGRPKMHQILRMIPRESGAKSHAFWHILQASPQRKIARKMHDSSE
jgi:hypothetical protein